MHHFLHHVRDQVTNTLLDLNPGERATFLGIQTGQSFWSRLIAMGFTPGVEVQMMQNYRRGPLLVAVRGTFVALGRGEASRMMVERKS
jgi:ferrous iron transport protein A